jgi:hypothetical protein
MIMGEWSKKVGEMGEAVAADFLRLIGWGAAQHGVELPCARGEAHKNGERIPPIGKSKFAL